MERSRKVHGEAKAGGDPADMDVGSRPLAIDENWPTRLAFRFVRFSTLLMGIGRADRRRLKQAVELYGLKRFKLRHSNRCSISTIIRLFLQAAVYL